MSDEHIEIEISNQSDVIFPNILKKKKKKRWYFDWLIIKLFFWL